MTDPMPDDTSALLDDLLNQATDLTENKVTYITNIRFTLGANEVTMDFYAVGPNPNNIRSPQAFRMHRMVMPLSLAKDIAGLLKTAMKQWEDAFGVALPLIQQHPLRLSKDKSSESFEYDNDDDETTT